MSGVLHQVFVSAWVSKKVSRGGRRTISLSLLPYEIYRQHCVNRRLRKEVSGEENKDANALKGRKAEGLCVKMCSDSTEGASGGEKQPVSSGMLLDVRGTQEKTEKGINEVTGSSEAINPESNNNSAEADLRSGDERGQIFRVG